MLGELLGHRQPRLHCRGQRRTGSDRVDADVLRPVFGGPRLGEQLDRRARGAVGSHAWLAVARDHRGDVDDRSAAAGGDLRGERGDEEERRLDVDLEQTVERRLVGVSRRCQGGKAGTVDQDIDLACRVGDAPHLGHLREISGDELRIVSTRPDLLHGARAAGLIAAGDDHRRALLGHRQCGGGYPSRRCHR